MRKIFQSFGIAYRRAIVASVFILILSGKIFANESRNTPTLTQRENDLLYNREFSGFIFELSKNSVDFWKELKRNNNWNKEFANSLINCKTKEEIQRLCKFNRVSYDVVVHSNVYPIAYYANFLYTHQTYASMGEEQQVSEFSELIKKICSSSELRETHGSSPLVTSLTNIINYVRTRCGNELGRLFNLTWDELGGCLVTGLGTFIASNYKKIRTAWSLLTGNFSLSNVITVLQLAFPEFTVATALIATSTCIIKEWIW